MEIHLNNFEIFHAAMVGLARNCTAIRDKRSLERGRKDLGWEEHINGALAEYAVSLALQVPWRPAVGHLDTDTGDVGRVHVKSTMRPDGSLIVRMHDPEPFTYVLALMHNFPLIELVGYLTGLEAKVKTYWRPAGGGLHREAYLVPQRDLNDMRDLVPKQSATSLL